MVWKQPSVDHSLSWPHPKQHGGVGGGTCLSGAQWARVCQIDQEVRHMK